MPTALAVIGLVLVIPIAVMAISLLAFFPAYPKNRIIKAAWMLLLATAIGLFGWKTLYVTPSPLPVWKPQAWYPTFELALFIFVPFATSLLLQRVRLRSPSKVSPTLSTFIVIAVCVLTYISLTMFNKHCVFFDYFHDSGQAWCPISWQATR